MYIFKNPFLAVNWYIFKNLFLAVNWILAPPPPPTPNLTDPSLQLQTVDLLLHLGGAVLRCQVRVTQGSKVDGAGLHGGGLGVEVVHGALHDGFLQRQVRAVQGAVLGHLVACHQPLLQGGLCCRFLNKGGLVFYLILVAGVDVGGMPQPQETWRQCSVHTPIHTTHPPTQTHTHAYTHTTPHKQSHACTHTNFHTCMHTHTQTFTHACTHTPTHTFHMHAHTHTHSYACTHTHTLTSW